MEIVQGRRIHKIIFIQGVPDIGRTWSECTWQIAFGPNTFGSRRSFSQLLLSWFVLSMPARNDRRSLIACKGFHPDNCKHRFYLSRGDWKDGAQFLLQTRSLLASYPSRQFSLGFGK